MVASEMLARRPVQQKKVPEATLCHRQAADGCDAKMDVEELGPLRAGLDKGRKRSQNHEDLTSWLQGTIQGGYRKSCFVGSI